MYTEKPDTQYRRKWEENIMKYVIIQFSVVSLKRKEQEKKSQIAGEGETKMERE